MKQKKLPVLRDIQYGSLLLFLIVVILYLQPLLWKSWLQYDRDIRLLIKFLTARADPEGGSPGAPPPKIGKNMIFLARNTPNIFAPPSARRNFLKYAPPNLKSWIRPWTVYTCITFHFFALALGGKGVFYSDKKISMLHFCTWKKKCTLKHNFCSGKKLSLYD
jgi:hypothetical protein